jgi:hypothetical protein
MCQERNSERFGCSLQRTDKFLSSRAVPFHFVTLGPLALGLNQALVVPQFGTGAGTFHSERAVRSHSAGRCRRVPFGRLVANTSVHSRSLPELGQAQLQCRAAA